MNDENEDLDNHKTLIDDIIPKNTEKLIKEAELSLKESKNLNKLKNEVSKINNLLKEKYFLKDNKKAYMK